jgi:hypothetical protein
LSPPPPVATVGPIAAEASAPRWWPPLIAFLVGVIGRLPALGAWWNQDDWGQLGRAAGLVRESMLPARWLSQVAYWRLIWPLCGLAPDPCTWTRLLLHGASAALVVRIAARGGLGQPAQLLAGLLYAATPLAFTPVYWASGVQELLGAFFALWAVERWLAGGRLRLPSVLLLALLSFLSKENGLGLPILLAALLLWGHHRPVGRLPAWLVLILLALAASGEALLVLRHFASGPGQPYEIGAWWQPLDNLAMYGWWLLSPGPLFASHFNLGMALAGWSLWLLWLAWAVRSWRRGSRWPAAGLLAALLVLAPSLLLRSHWYPYLALLAAAAGSLTLASLLPPRWQLRPLAALLLVLAAWGWAYGGMTWRLKARDARGLPADPVVQRTAISYAAVNTMRHLPPRADGSAQALLVLLQPPRDAAQVELTERLGSSWVSGSLLYNALEGRLGPRLVLPDSVSIVWANDLLDKSQEAFVLVDAGTQLIPWGPVPQALLYLSLTEVARDQFRRARRHLLRAGQLGETNLAFFFDEDLLLEPLDRLRSRADAFETYLAGPGGSGRVPGQRNPLQDLFVQLLQACEGPGIPVPRPRR